MYDQADKSNVLRVASFPDFADEFLMYGFMQRVHRDRPRDNTGSRMGSVLSAMRIGPTYHLVYTDKLERFKFWLAFNDMLPDRITGKLISKMER